MSELNKQNISFIDFKRLIASDQACLILLNCYRNHHTKFDNTNMPELTISAVCYVLLTYGLTYRP